MRSLTAEKKTWYIAHNEMDVVHCGEVEAGQSLTTGQPVLETFESEIAWIARQIELGIPQEDHW
jgi:hypothetical protein